MTKALVTGANGHIGSSLVRELAQHGYDVVALVRDGADERSLAGTGVTIARGDVLDAASIERAVAGREVVFHCAAPYQTWARDPKAIIEPAVRGTENVLRVAKAAGVRRVVVTGSCNAVGFTRGEPYDETHHRETARSPYMIAKLEQERAAIKLAKELELEVVVVLPTTVIGPNDWRMTPTMAPFVEIFRGKNPVPFAMNLVDVRDVAMGHRLAAERGKPGERYLLGGDNATMEQLRDWIEKETGKRPKLGLPPMWILRIVAGVAELIASISGKPPVITNAVIDDAEGGTPLFKIDKARSELGYSPRPGAEVIKAAVEWARERGWI